jgi:hypothetical protein
MKLPQIFMPPNPITGALPNEYTALQRSEQLDMLLRGNGTSTSTIDAIVRGDSLDGVDVNQQLALTIQQLQRGIVTTQTAFPVRENLEAQVQVLVPQDTPVRNMIPRIPQPGGLATAWRQNTSMGGGWGSNDNPGGGSAAQVFFGESGAPAQLTSVYAAKSAAFKLLGQIGSVTGFAMATGQNFMNQYLRERQNAMRNLMLNEENALINGSSTSTAAPWGDGTTAFGFDGLVNLITTANGTPSGQVQTSVGALTLAHIDSQIVAMWARGGRDMYILANKQEVQSITNLLQASGTIIRTQTGGSNNQVSGGIFVVSYVHPITGEEVKIIPSRFVPAGTMLFGSQRNTLGQSALEVAVLPQVQLPELAPNAQVQGYTVQDIAPAIASPQVFAFIVSVYETLMMKDATIFAKSTGVTAV